MRIRLITAAAMLLLACPGRGPTPPPPRPVVPDAGTHQYNPECHVPKGAACP